MRLKVLVDNYTYIDEYYFGEPGVSYYIEDQGQAILFDVGYSDLFLKNAKAMKIDLSQVSSIVLSHGHNDHTGGLKHFFKQDREKAVAIITHPHTFNQKTFAGEKISAPFTKNEMKKLSDLVLTKKPLKLTKNITFLGQIPRVFPFENNQPLGLEKSKGKWQDDYLLDDSALVYQGSDGIFIITGCSHSGICNIIEYAKKITNDPRVIGLIGGFHLFDVNQRLDQTIDYFIDNKITELYPCHCTSFFVKAAIHQKIPIHEVGVGMEISVK